MKSHWLALPMLLMGLAMPSRNAEAQDRSQARSMVLSRYGIVASENPLASQAGEFADDLDNLQRNPHSNCLYHRSDRHQASFLVNAPALTAAMHHGATDGHHQSDDPIYTILRPFFRRLHIPGSILFHHHITGVPTQYRVTAMCQQSTQDQAHQFVCWH